MEKIVIIVPAHNEELYLGNLLQSLQKLKGFKTQELSVHEIVVVDDGSTDKTSEIAHNAGFSVVRNNKNCGKAFAFFSGVQQAKRLGATIVVTLDADLKEVSTHQLLELVRPVIQKQAQMTIGTVQGDVNYISGQRAILMKALQPLLNGNRKWNQYFGLRNGQPVRRMGFGLETALNRCLADMRPGLSRSLQFVPTRFWSQRSYEMKRVVGSPDTIWYRDQMKKEMGRAEKIALARQNQTQRLKEQRKKALPKNK